MEHITASPGHQAPGEIDRRDNGNRLRLIIGIVLWIIGFMVLAVVSVIIRAHPASYPIEIQFANLIQGPHPVPCVYRIQQPRTWIDGASDIINRMNDPIPSIIFPLILMGVMALFRLFWQALFLGLTTLAASTVWGGITILVARPRLTPSEGICVHRVIQAYSFPSGHVMHDVAFYGFLLYLSFSKPVRQWRHHGLLLPLQILVVLYLLVVGYARVESGEHHLFDVLGAYLAGVLCLFFFVFFYEMVLRLWAKHRAKKLALK